MTLVLQPDEPDALEKSSRLVHLLVNSERIVSSFALVSMFTLVLIQVLSRYVFHSPLTWTEELARFSLVWLTFVGAGFVMARRQHIVVDLFAKALGLRAERVINGFAILVVLLVSGVLTWAGLAFASVTSVIKAPATQIPMSFVYGAAAVGFALIFIHGVLNTVYDIRHRGSGTTDAAPDAAERPAS